MELKIGDVIRDYFNAPHPQMDLLTDLEVQSLKQHLLQANVGISLAMVVYNPEQFSSCVHSLAKNCGNAVALFPRSSENEDYFCLGFPDSNLVVLHRDNYRSFMWQKGFPLFFITHAVAPMPEECLLCNKRCYLTVDEALHKFSATINDVQKENTGLPVAGQIAEAFGAVHDAGTFVCMRCGAAYHNTCMDPPGSEMFECLTCKLPYFKTAYNEWLVLDCMAKQPL